MLPAELENASQTQKPNFYYARHMQPGTCRYEKETVLVDVDALKSMISTGNGIPVYIQHQVGVPIDQVKEKACGYVTESFYNTLDGWAWFKFMAIDDEARLVIANGWSISNAYAPTKFSGGGTKNAVKFDRNVVDGRFTHLALVPNPRYENAKIYTPEEFKAYQDELKAKLPELQNSLPPSAPLKGKNMFFKFLRAKQEEVTNSADATHVELEDGKVVTAAEFKEMLNGKAKKNESSVDKDAKDEEMDNAVCDVDGEKMTVKDMKNAVRKMKKNEADEKAKKDEEEKKNAEAKDQEEKKNAADAAAKKKEEDEKTNGKGYFEQMLNARDKSEDQSVVTRIDTPANMTARGKARYGSGK